MLGFNASDEHYQLLLDFINDSTVVDLSNNVVNASIDIRKNHKTKLPDAIIAATAIAFDYTLITRNLADFKNIYGLRIINPWDL